MNAMRIGVLSSLSRWPRPWDGYRESGLQCYMGPVQEHPRGVPGEMFENCREIAEMAEFRIDLIFSKIIFGNTTRFTGIGYSGDGYRESGLQCYMGPVQEQPRGVPGEMFENCREIAEMAELRIDLIFSKIIFGNTTRFTGIGYSGDGYRESGLQCYMGPVQEQPRGVPGEMFENCREIAEMAELRIDLIFSKIIFGNTTRFTGIGYSGDGYRESGLQCYMGPVQEQPRGVPGEMFENCREIAEMAEFRIDLIFSKIIFGNTTRFTGIGYSGDGYRESGLQCYMGPVQEQPRGVPGEMFENCREIAEMAELRIDLIFSKIIFGNTTRFTGIGYSGDGYRESGLQCYMGPVQEQPRGVPGEMFENCREIAEMAEFRIYVNFFKNHFREYHEVYGYRL